MPSLSEKGKGEKGTKEGEASPLLRGAFYFSSEPRGESMAAEYRIRSLGESRRDHRINCPE